MRKRVVIVCVLAALVALAGLRLFGFVGMGSGATGVQGDPVRFSATPLVVKLLKGEPDSAAPNGDTPSVRWRYEDQVAFGRSCSIEYTIYSSGDFLRTLLLDGVTGVTVEIPVADGEDGLRVADMVYGEMLGVYARKGDHLIENDWAPSEREGVLREASLTFPSSALPQSVCFTLYADRVLIGASWLV